MVWSTHNQYSLCNVFIMLIKCSLNKISCFIDHFRYFLIPGISWFLDLGGGGLRILPTNQPTHPTKFAHILWLSTVSGLVPNWNSSNAHTITHSWKTKTCQTVTHPGTNAPNCCLTFKGIPPFKWTHKFLQIQLKKRLLIVFEFLFMANKKALEGSVVVLVYLLVALYKFLFSKYLFGCRKKSNAARTLCSWIWALHVYI